jgi:hypothetical protein
MRVNAGEYQKKGEANEEITELHAIKRAIALDLFDFK